MKRNIIKLQKGTTTIEKERYLQKVQSEKEKRILNKLLSESLGLGISISVPMVGGVLAGVVLDKWLGTTPKLTLILLFTGVIVSAALIIKIILTAKET